MTCNATARQRRAHPLPGRQQQMPISITAARYVASCEELSLCRGDIPA